MSSQSKIFQTKSHFTITITFSYIYAILQKQPCHDDPTVWYTVKTVLYWINGSIGVGFSSLSLSSTRAQMSSLLTNRLGDQSSQHAVQTLVAGGGLDRRGDGALQGSSHPCLFKAPCACRFPTFFPRQNVVTSFPPCSGLLARVSILQSWHDFLLFLGGGGGVSKQKTRHAIVLPRPSWWLVQVNPWARIRWPWTDYGFGSQGDRMCSGFSKHKQIWRQLSRITLKD